MLADSEYTSVNGGQGSSVSEKGLLDLSYLTEKEKEAIRRVIKRDVMLNKESLCSLEIAIHDGRQDQKDRSQENHKHSGKNLCYSCGSSFVTVCDRLTSQTCAQCKSPMCKTCSVKAKKRKFCTVCYRERFFDLRSTEVELVQSRDLKNFTTSQIFGSYLLKLSLENTLKQVPALATVREAAQEDNLEIQPRDRANTSPAILQEKKKKLLRGKQIPEKLQELVPASGEEMEPRKSIRVPSIDDPNCGFKLMRVTDNADNFAEVSSLYSEPSYDSTIKVTGTIKFGVWYRDEEQILYVRIKKAKDLAKIPGKDLNPYVKVYLLPDKTKHTKRKTGFLRKTNNPEFDEIVKYKLSREALPTTTLWLSVWDCNMTGANKFLGEVMLPLTSSALDLSNSKDIKYPLTEHTFEEDETDSSAGRICIGLMFDMLSYSETHKKLGGSSLNLNRRESDISETSLEIQKHLSSSMPLEDRRTSTKSETLPLAFRKGMLSIGKSTSVDTPGEASRVTSLSPVHDPSLSVPTLTGSLPRPSQGSLTVPETFPGGMHKRGSSSVLGKLRIRIRSAEGLPSMDSAGDTNPFVRCFLLPNLSLTGKKKSSVAERTLDPVWEEELVYDMVKLEELTCSRALEVSVWDMDRRGTNSFMGAVRLGPEPHPLGSSGGPDWMDSMGEEVAQWELMLANPGEWVETWHQLRPSLSSLHAKHRAEHGVEGGADEEHTSTEAALVDTEEAPMSAEIEEKDGTRVTSLPKLLELNLNRRGKGGHYEISGDVVLGLSYEAKVKKLKVKVIRAHGLAAVNKKTSDPYVKLYLLPDKNSKRKTKVKKKTLNPVFNKTFKYDISSSDLKDSSLWVSVWSNKGIFKHNQFLGETCIPFDTYEFDTPMEEKYFKLSDYSKMDMIPNPNLARRQSTIYRVRTRTTLGASGVPTLYDSSTDLREGADGLDKDKTEPVPATQDMEDIGFVVPVINVEEEESGMEATGISVERDISQSPELTPTPPVRSSPVQSTPILEQPSSVRTSPSLQSPSPPIQSPPPPIQSPPEHPSPAPSPVRTPTPSQLTSRSSSPASQVTKSDGHKTPTTVPVRSPAHQKHQAKKQSAARSAPKPKYSVISASTRPPPRTASKTVSSSKVQTMPRSSQGHTSGGGTPKTPGINSAGTTATNRGEHCEHLI